MTSGAPARGGGGKPCVFTHRLRASPPALAPVPWPPWRSLCWERSHWLENPTVNAGVGHSYHCSFTEALVSNTHRERERDTHVVHVAVNAAFLFLLLLLVLFLLLVFLRHDVIQVTEIVLREHIIHGLSHRDQRKNLEKNRMRLTLYRHIWNNSLEKLFCFGNGTVCINF